MKLKTGIFFLVFWWAVIYPQFFFSDKEQLNINNNDVIYTSFISEYFSSHSGL